MLLKLILKGMVSEKGVADTFCLVRSVYYAVCAVWAKVLHIHIGFAGVAETSFNIR